MLLSRLQPERATRHVYENSTTPRIVGIPLDRHDPVQGVSLPVTNDDFDIWQWISESPNPAKQTLNSIVIPTSGATPASSQDSQLANPGPAAALSRSGSSQPSNLGGTSGPWICIDHDPIVTFQRFKDYERHQNTVHGDKKNLLRCPGNKCTYKTSRADNLKRHRRTKGH